MQHLPSVMKVYSFSSLALPPTITLSKLSILFLWDCAFRAITSCSFFSKWNLLSFSSNSSIDDFSLLTSCPVLIHWIVIYALSRLWRRMKNEDRRLRGKSGKVKVVGRTTIIKWCRGKTVRTPLLSYSRQSSHFLMGMDNCLESNKIEMLYWINSRYGNEIKWFDTIDRNFKQTHFQYECIRN